MSARAAAARVKRSTPPVLLFHWNAPEAASRRATLRAAGFEAECCTEVVPGLRSRLAARPPLAAVIDLSRSPALGRDLGIGLRVHKATRAIPLVFVDGAPDKVARVREHLPDAVYATWDSIGSAVTDAVRHQPAEPVAPKSVFAGYGHVPLAKKLGIAPGTRVVVIDPPPDLDRVLSDLPADVTVTRTGRGDRDLTIWFAQSRRDFDRRLPRVAEATTFGPLWIAWAKKTSPAAAGLSQAIVRKPALALGLVDYKVCAIDDTWTGLLFRRRRP